MAEEHNSGFSLNNFLYCFFNGNSLITPQFTPQKSLESTAFN